MSKENFYNEEAINKLREIAEGARVCMMTTELDAKPSPSRPMSLQSVDDNGILWFISGKKSDKNYELRKDAHVQLFFMNNSASEYLSVYGNAEIYSDQKTINEHWSDAAQSWFEEGKEDPNVSIIGIKPLDVKYWGTENGKFIDSALMLYSAITGDNVEVGKTGKLNV